MDNYYYETLGLSRTATTSEIKKKYKELALIHHPDKVPDEKKEESEKKFKEITEAYSILTDPEKRKIYDDFGREGINRQHMGPSAEDINNIFKHMFHFQMPFAHFGGNNRPFSNNNTQHDIRINELLTLKEVFTGKKITKEIKRNKLCESCDGTGFTDKQTHTCPKCNGIGNIIRIQQIANGFSTRMQEICNICKGSGIDSPNNPKCTDCNGRKIIEETFNIEYEFPPGTIASDVIILKNVGHEITKGVRSNIIISVSEQQDATFKRYLQIGRAMDPSNLLIEIQITLAESLCGFKKNIQNINGETITLTESNIIKNDEIKFIENYGVPIKNTDKRGKLFIKYNITYPAKLSNNQKAKILDALNGKKHDHQIVHNSNTKNIDDYVPDLRNDVVNESSESDHEHVPDQEPECNNQ